MPQENAELIYAYNNPNWIDSALRRCSRYSIFGHWKCGRCCNVDICNTFQQEDREARRKEYNETYKAAWEEFIITKINIA